MRLTFPLLLILLLPLRVLGQEEAPPLPCPHCGMWDVNAATPGVAVGERILVTEDRVTLPGCGEFRPAMAEQDMVLDVDDRRSYRSMLLLRPIVVSGPCDMKYDEPMRLEVEVSAGHKRDGGLARFAAFRPGEKEPAYVATAWNYERDNPCESGAGAGSAACLEVANARQLKMMAYEYYVAFQQRDPEAPGNDLNITRFAARALAFCLRREAGSGGGSWPYVWALSCQAEFLEQKLAQLRAFSACRASPDGGDCPFPIDDSDALLARRD